MAASVVVAVAGAVAVAVAAAGVKVEQSINFDRAAMRPQSGQKWPRPQSKNSQIATL